jgi:CheY-like chemotaxis protein
VTTRLARDGRVLIEVRDTGSGMTPEVQRRIFDPFFTTKPVGVGTGLGLSICHGIVKSLGGEITVDSVLGKGSAFRVFLKASAATAVAAPPVEAKAAEVVAPRRGKILVVDDEPSLTRALRRALSDLHDVTVLNSSRQALQLMTSGGDFDLVFCDLMMPELTGMDLHAALASARPDLCARMVFITGGAFTPRAREFLEQVPNHRVEKPIDNDALRAYVQQRLQ